MSNVHIHTLLNPVTRESVYTTIKAGKPLSAYLSVPDGVLMYRNGLNYDDEVLHSGDVLNLICVPKGGEQGKNIGRTAIVIGATLLAASVNPFAAGSIGASLFVAGAQVAATLGAGALIPPPNISTDLGDNAQFQRLGSLTGTRNRVNPYGASPKVYGKRKIFPPMSARPYTEIEGNRQYLRALFMITEGPCQLTTPKIGDTVIGTFDTNNQFTSNGGFEEVEIDVGESPSLYTNSIFEENPNATLNTDADTVTRTTQTGVDEISLDIVFPQGVFGLTEQGKTTTHYVDFTIEYRQVGTTPWNDVLDDIQLGRERRIGGFVIPNAVDVFRASSSQRETWRGSLSWKVDSGQYEVRVTRVDTFEDPNTTQTFDNASWSVLRSISYESPTNMTGVVQLAMRIKATDQLSGILDTFSVVCESRLATYNGSAWSEPTFNAANGTGTGGALTSNPAWVMADLLTGSATSRPISKYRLSAASIKSWADNCTTEGRKCNLVIDRAQTVLQTASVIGSTGRGSLALIDGVYKIIQDTTSTPVQHFTPRNSWGFSSVRSFPDVPHAIRVNFVNPAADWETDEAVVYDDGYSEDGTNCLFGDGTGVCKEATEFETLDLQGVTSWDQAWKEGRYRLAEARLRPERYSWNADVENIVCNRGDLVRVSHDVTLWGQIAGRIKGISGNVLTLDEQVVMESGQSYNIRVRTQSGGSEVKTVTTSAGSTDTITVNNTTGLGVGDLFSFGNVGTETQELKILSIEPSGDLTARIVAVDAAPEIYDADTGSIPPFDSNITPPVGPNITSQAPPSPSILYVRSGRDSLNNGLDETPQMKIAVTFAVGAGRPTIEVEGRYRLSEDSQWTGYNSVEASVGTLPLFDVVAGSTYIVQIRAKTSGKTSDWVQSAPHTVEDVVLPPYDEFTIGELTADVSSRVSALPLKLKQPIREGMVYEIHKSRGGVPAWFSVGGDSDQVFGPGELNVPIFEQTLFAKEGDLVKVNMSVFASQLLVDPHRILLNVQRERGGEAIGTLSVDTAGVFLGSLPLKDVEEEVELKNGQILHLYNQEGDYDKLTVNGDQTVTPTTHTVLLNSKTLDHSYKSGYAWLREPSFKQTGRLTVEAGRIDANVTNINIQATQIAGLELDVTEQGVAIANVFAHTNYDGGANFSSLNLRSDLNSAQAQLTATTAVAENGAAVMRSTTPPVQRPDGSALKVGDYWIDPTPYVPDEVQHDIYTWTGIAWQQTNDALKVVTAGVKAVTDKYSAKAMMFADVDGTIAFVKATASPPDDLGTVTIKGENILLDGDTTVQGDFIKIRDASLNVKAGISAATDLGDSSVRYWAGHADKNAAPFKVLQSGKVIGTDIEATGKFMGEHSGTVGVTDDMQSSNFVDGVSGWRFQGNGNIQGQDIEARGVFIGDIQPNDDMDLPAGKVIRVHNVILTE